MKNGVSKVYTDRPDYADFDSPAKFEAIKSIIAKRLIEHPDAICSYSGGSDSDIMLDLIERTRAMFELPPIKYVFFNTGLEMKATRDHIMRWSTPYAQYLWNGDVMYGNPTSRTYGPKRISFTSALAHEEWAKYAREVYGEQWKKVYQAALKRRIK